MSIKGIDRYENLSFAGGPRPGPPVRFGDYAVPAAVAWVSQPIGQSPLVRAEFEMRKGAPVCLSVTITATPKGRPVTTADLESIPGLDRKGLDAFKALGNRVVDDEDWHEGRNLSRAGQLHAPNPKDVGTALRKRPDEELERVATVYRDNITDSPVQAVQEAFGIKEHRTAQRRIKAARDRGFLPQTSQGRRKA
jgi:hypothetical protein